MPGDNFFFPINFILQLKFKLLLKALATFSISGVQYADIKYARSLRVIYLHCTVTLTVAIAGVPTPLLAVHWYWIMLSSVPGLLTLTVTCNAWEITSELPTLVHAILGLGLPDAVHVKFKLSPRAATDVLFDISADGGTGTWVELVREFTDSGESNREHQCYFKGD